MPENEIKHIIRLRGGGIAGYPRVSSIIQKGNLERRRQPIIACAEEKS